MQIHPWCYLLLKVEFNVIVHQNNDDHGAYIDYDLFKQTNTKKACHKLGRSITIEAKLVEFIWQSEGLYSKHRNIDKYPYGDHRIFPILYHAILHTIGRMTLVSMKEVALTLVHLYISKSTCSSHLFDHQIYVNLVMNWRPKFKISFTKPLCIP